MSLETIRAMAIIAIFCGLALFMASDIRRNKAVSGSRQRYVASSLRIVGALVVGFNTLLKAALNIMLDGPWPTIAADGLLALIYLWIAWRGFDDDNWFNDQWKRIKRGFKKLKQRLASIKLTPIPLPSPA